MQRANMKSKAIDTTDFSRCSISKVVQEALGSYSFEDKQQQALVHWHGGADFNFVGSPRLSKHIVWNLLNNALQYIRSESKGEITLWLESDARYNYLHFKDSAKGISSEI